MPFLPSKCVITQRPSFSVDCGCWQKPTQHTVELKCLQRTHSTFSSFLFLRLHFPFLSSPCFPSINITREQALENRTELFLKDQSCKWPKTFFVNGWGEGWPRACEVSTAPYTWPGGKGKRIAIATTGLLCGRPGSMGCSNRCSLLSEGVLGRQISSAADPWLCLKLSPLGVRWRLSMVLHCFEVK